MPKIGFSDITIRNLKYSGKQVEYSDSADLKGVAGYLCLLVGKTGKAFAVRYRMNGKRKRFALGTYPDTSLKEARKKAVAILVKVESGFDPSLAKKEYREAETFSDLWEQYLKSPKFKAKVLRTQTEDHRRFNNFLNQPLGDMKLVDIRKKHLSAILSQQAEQYPVSANRLYSLLSVLFKFALNKDLIEQHPMFGMDKPAKEKPRSRYLNKDEIKELWPAFDTCRSNVRDIFRLLLLTAQRPGQVMGMTWSEIDWDACLWTIPRPRTKTKIHDHLVPLSPQAIQILDARRQGESLTKRTQWKCESEYVFPSRKGKEGHTVDVDNARYKLIKNLKMEQWDSHDLRRTGRTLMSKINIEPNVAERVLDHSMGKIEGTYDVYGYLPQKTVALNKLGREIDRILGIEVDTKIVPLRRQA